MIVKDAYLKKTVDYRTNKPTFLEWLQDRHDVTPMTQRILCQQTARCGSGYSEYEKCMEWYRQRFRYEMELREQLIPCNPFIEEENHNGNDGRTYN